MRLAYDDEGSGPPVLLLHSAVCDRRMWQVQAATLAAGRRVVRPDLRGFGESPLPGGPYRDVDDVVELLDLLGISRTSVVGSSFGGRVALELASMAPERVGSMVLLCPAVPGAPRTADLEAFADEEDRLLEAGEVEAAVELNVRTWVGPEASSGVRDLVRAMQRRAFQVQLAAERQNPAPAPVPVDFDPSTVRAPVLVVSGEHDLDHHRFAAGRLVTALPRAEHVALSWAGHLPSLERPEEVADLLSQALAGTH